MVPKTVFVLGAGCSVSSGYPLAGQLGAALKEFGGSIGGGATELKKAIDTTVCLLDEVGAKTLDELVLRIHRRELDDPRHAEERAFGIRERRILKAKISTAAYFLSLEQQAKKRHLASYERFIRERLFPGNDHWPQRLRKAQAHVISFNYDRLFEMALLRAFEIDTDSQLLYGEDILNSGMNHSLGSSMGFKEQRFSFLKLHGSVGMRIHEENGIPCYYPYWDGARPGDPVELNDDRFFKNSHQPLPQNRDPEPLLVFPFEKDFVRSGSYNNLQFRDYIARVWEHAEKLLSDAKEVWFIGYSFAEMDRGAVVNLLRQATRCERIVIQNPGGEAERICTVLHEQYPDLTIPFIPLGEPF